MNKTINSDVRKQFIDKKIREFSEYSLVITDRLHAMVFSALGHTPCIAFDNSSKKVSGVYEWIKDNQFVICVEQKELEISHIKALMDFDNIFFDSNRYNKYFIHFLEETSNGKN